MNIAVLSLVRDRLEYTQHCFSKLHEFAGCEFDHYVLDNGSDAETWAWLRNYSMEHSRVSTTFREPENIGISAALNRMLDHIEGYDYDVAVKIDNDCELTEPNTLRDVCELVISDGYTFLSPRILGLNNPPHPQGIFLIAGEEIQDIVQIGGIFLAAPAHVYNEYRYPESGPMWGMDDADICRWFRGRGGRCGYVTRLTANHFESTSGQWSRYPEYFARTLAEGKPSL